MSNSLQRGTQNGASRESRKRCESLQKLAAQGPGSPLYYAERQSFGTPVFPFPFRANDAIIMPSTENRAFGMAATPNEEQLD